MIECVFAIKCALPAACAAAHMYTPAFDAYLFAENALGRIEEMATDAPERRRIHVYPDSRLLGALAAVIRFCGLGDGAALYYEATQWRAAPATIAFELRVPAYAALRVDGETRVTAARDGHGLPLAGHCVQQTRVCVTTGTAWIDTLASLFVAGALRTEYERMAAALVRYTALLGTGGGLAAPS